MTAAQARARFATARVARLATVRPDGAPHLVPLVFALDADTIYSAVDDKPKRTTELVRLANLAAEPRVCVLADHYEEDWSALWWVRADGRGRVVDGAEEMIRARGLLSVRYPQQRVAGAVLAVDVERFRGWAATEGPEPAIRR